MIQEYVDILQADPWVWNGICTTAGMIGHTFKRVRDLKISPLEYWATYRWRSVTAVMSIYGSYIGMMLTNPSASPGEFLALGYMLDNLLNKAESGEVRELKAEVESYRCENPNCSDPNCEKPA